MPNSKLIHLPKVIPKPLGSSIKCTEQFCTVANANFLSCQVITKIPDSWLMCLFLGMPTITPCTMVNCRYRLHLRSEVNSMYSVWVTPSQKFFPIHSHARFSPVEDLTLYVADNSGSQEADSKACKEPPLDTHHDVAAQENLPLHWQFWSFAVGCSVCAIINTICVDLWFLHYHRS